MLTRHAWRVVFLVAAAMVLAGCGGSSSPPVSVSLSPSSSATIDQSLTVAITATVTHDSSAQGVKWTLNGPGSLTASTGPSVTYNPPAGSIASAEQATVTATSAADPAKSASLAITVNSATRGWRLECFRTRPR
jgi:hypothetical protein